MSRDRTTTRDRSGDVSEESLEFGTGDALGDAGGAETPETTDADRTDAGLTGRAKSKATSLFSPRSFLIAFALIAVGLFATSTFLPLPGAGLVGVFAAAFLFGFVVNERRYAEVAAAGGGAVAASTFLDFAVVAVLGGFGISLTILGGLGGAAAGLLGAYFGRDLRDGLTREI
ncbi:uncharacterized protein NP_2491G [Natronomonas pharaonis DSM 2160]|uniref:Uncharacterized protein n=1 Tax=Natronomonas pharaonis (strain ATCC 35678 / DSM 2160 / CIP 103997 / JCM 8858 / NBRC 14720 / NCIMB 2260 / Gabara) TaxID=348780 RepID=A0A1U7EZP8_NATPD|nr:hypothetical protein [Natronomonas pharaonis]CCI69580.1 uncharacterized protein NP_2491G [Natronomonas pharaonis DSM 2160]